MHYKNKDAKSLTELGKYLLNSFFWKHCQELYLEPNKKSMVKLFCKNSEGLLAANLFHKKAPP